MVGCVIDPMYLTSSETKPLLGLLQTLNSEAAPETLRGSDRRARCRVLRGDGARSVW
jgi:hypothetical protein